MDTLFINGTFSCADSFIFTVTCPPGPGANAEPWKRLAQLATYLDTSAYDDAHPLFKYNHEIRDYLFSLRIANKGKLGCFKDEVGCGMIKSLYCLRPKSYSIEAYSYHSSVGSPSSTFELNKMKGIAQCVVRNEISHKNFKTIFTDTLPQRHSMRIIRSHLHHLYIEELEKLSLTLYDDKRFWISRQCSFPFGGVPADHVSSVDTSASTAVTTTTATATDHASTAITTVSMALPSPSPSSLYRQ